MTFAAAAEPPMSGIARLIASMEPNGKALLPPCKALLPSVKRCFNLEMTNEQQKPDLGMAEKIREVIGAGGFTWKSLKDAGIVNSRQTVNGWISTGRIKKENLGAIAEFTGIPLDWWHTPKGMPRPTAKQMLQAAQSGERVEAKPPTMTPVVGDARLGTEGFFEETASDVGVDGWVEYPARDGAYALRCKGDSMYPRINAGEFVVIKPKKTARETNTVAVQTVKGQRMIKVLDRLNKDGSIRLTSINGDHKPITLEADEYVHIHVVAAICQPDEYYEHVS